MTKKGTTVIATRIPDKQVQLLDVKAHQRGLTRSTYVRDVLINHLNNTSEPLIAESLVKILTTLKKLTGDVSFSNQLFHAWLGHYFSTHPEIPESEKKTIVTAALTKRDMFIEIFIKEIYTDNSSFFDRLLTKVMEKETTDGE